MTQWHNPTSHRQRIVVHDEHNQPHVIVWQPGETREVPNTFDAAIQAVRCDEPECHGRACHRGHHGIVVGGLAPALQRVNNPSVIHPALGLDGKEI